MNILMLSEFAKGPFNTLELGFLYVISSHYCVIKLYLLQCNFPNLEPIFATVVFNGVIFLDIPLSKTYWLSCLLLGLVVFCFRLSVNVLFGRWLLCKIYILFFNGILLCCGNLLLHSLVKSRK